jgi:ubiquinone/menaquinone biosynthesis C-methylase UbiE
MIERLKALTESLRRIVRPGGALRQKAVREAMKREWDVRAKDNARHYVATSREQWSDDDFFHSGTVSVDEIVSKDLEVICKGRPAAEIRVLEIGCGAGRMTLPLSRIFGRVDAVDVSPEMISQAKSALGGRSNVQFHVNNGVDLGMFRKEQFDFALSAIVFQHIPRQAIVENYIRETWRVLRRNTLFTFQVQGCPIKEDVANTWVGAGFNEEEMHTIAKRAGFEVRDSLGAGTQYYWLTFRKP